MEAIVAVTESGSGPVRIIKRVNSYGGPHTGWDGGDAGALLVRHDVGTVTKGQSGRHPAVGCDHNAMPS